MYSSPSLTWSSALGSRPGDGSTARDGCTPTRVAQAHERLCSKHTSRGCQLLWRFSGFFSFPLSCWRALAGHHPVSKPPETSHIGHSKPLKCMIFPLVFGQGAEVLSPVSPSLRALPSKRMNLQTEERCFTKKPRVPFADRELEGFVSLFHSPAPFVPKPVYFNVSV